MQKWNTFSYILISSYSILLLAHLYQNKINKCDNKIMPHHLCVPNGFIVDLLPALMNFSEISDHYISVLFCIIIIGKYINHLLYIIHYLLHKIDKCFCLICFYKDKHFFFLSSRYTFRIQKTTLLMICFVCLLNNRHYPSRTMYTT